MFTERDHKFATDVLNASLTLMSMLVAVITVLGIKYEEVKGTQLADPLHVAVIFGRPHCFRSFDPTAIRTMEYRLQQSGLEVALLG
jgi:hypothetical protein